MKPGWATALLDRERDAEIARQLRYFVALLVALDEAIRWKDIGHPPLLEAKACCHDALGRLLLDERLRR